MKRFGNTVLRHGLFLAPMAGYSDGAMRRICTEYGAEYLTGEMVSAKAVCFGDRKTAELCHIRREEGISALQLFGSDPEILGAAAEKICVGFGGGVMPAAIDLNMGCPVHKIVSNGEGSALMRDPERVYAIVSSVVRHSSLPVSVKLRAGWDETNRNAVEIARVAEEAGAAFLCVHGRTKMQMYAGKVDRSIIADVKKSVHIPVIGNGDITDVPSALAMLAETGCDGIAIGRGAVGNPFLFREIAEALDGKPQTPVTAEARVEAALRQLRYAIAEKGETHAVCEARKQMTGYVHGYHGAAALRAKIHTATTYAEIEALFSDWYDALCTDGAEYGEPI